MERQRIDKWLWHARVVRTRSAAADLVANGLVRIGGTRTTASSRPVRVGDVVTVALDRVRILRVAGFAERRGSATEAGALFEDLSPPVPLSVAQKDADGAIETRRPAKHERRVLMRLKRPEIE